MADPGQNRDEAARASAAHAAAGPAAADAGPTPPASSDLRANVTVAPGDCLAGRFLIEQELGRGGAGTVFIAQDRTLGRAVAIKVLTHAPDAHALARFAQEARAAGALEHPNVLAVHDVGVHEGVPFIVSELLRGRTLRARLAEGPLQAREATDLALQLARGLAATHEQGILHRDLKPENIFLLEDGRLKILDFGLAKLLPSAPASGDRNAEGNLGTVSGAVLGTVPYMSPEQVRGRAADARSDVFAFGAVLHEMLSGTAPFAGESPFDVGHAILNAEPSRLPEAAPAALRALVRRCLAKDPEDRVQTARELVQLLETGAPAPRVSKWRSGRFWALAAAGALWAALLGTVAARRLLPDWPWRSAPAATRRLAVLPFRALGASADGEALCAGLGEILTNKLRQVERFQRSLHVVSAADVSREHVVSAREALNAFGATLAVSGSLQWNGEKILVGATLVDARSQLVVAARDFEVGAHDVPAIGRLLVENVAQMLELELQPEAQRALADPPSPAYAQYLAARGHLRRYDRVENIDRALAAFDSALAQDPAYALAHAGRAEAWLRHYQIIRDPAALEQARASSRRALELGPDLAQVHFTAGLVDLSGGEYAHAIEILKRALQIEPANADTMRELGNAYDAAGKEADAETTFRHAAELRPDSWAASKDLAVFYNRHGRLEDALPWFQRVVAMTPDSAASYSNLGGIYLRLGRHGEAAAALQKSLALRPTSNAYMNFGSIRYFEGRFREASDAYRKAAELAPSDERIWGALADALRWLPGNADEVIGAYRQAIALGERKAAINPSDPELRSRLAMYHAYAGDRDAADRESSEALRLAPRDGTVLFRAALVREQLGRREDALAALEQSFLAGYSREEIGKAPALEQLRQDPRYALIAGKPPTTTVQSAR